MKPIHIISLCIIFIISACNNSSHINKQLKSKNTGNSITIINNKKKHTGNPDITPDVKKIQYIPGNCPLRMIMDNDTINVLKRMFVINTNGITAYSNTKGKKQTFHLDYGEGVYVLRDSANWYTIEKDYQKLFVKKTDVVDEIGIPLDNAALNEELDVKPDHFPNIHIKLINKEQFYEMKNTSINYFEADTQLVKKTKNKFSLTFDKKTRSFVDNKENDYEYIGQFESLNSYVVEIGSDEAERSMFFLLDKNTGKTKYTFPTMPYMSIDKKFFISIDELEDDMADVYVYKNVNGTNYDYAFGRYKNWLMAKNNENFWGSDGCFYALIFPKIAYLNHDNAYCLPGGSYRYIRIKIKGISSLSL